MNYYVVATPKVVDAITGIRTATDTVDYLGYVIRTLGSINHSDEELLTDAIIELTNDLCVINGCVFSRDPLDFMVQQHILEEMLLTLYNQIMIPYYLTSDRRLVKGHIKEIELHGHIAIIRHTGVCLTDMCHR